MKWHGVDVVEFVSPLENDELNAEDFPQTYYEDGHIYIAMTEPLERGGKISVKFDDLFSESMRLNNNTLDKKDLLKEIDGFIANFENIIFNLKKQKAELCKKTKNTP